MLEELIAADPRQLPWQRDAAISLNKRGRILQARGEFMEALTDFRRGLGMIQGISATRPAETLWRHDEASAHQYIGDLQLKLGLVEEARDSFSVGAEIRRSLAGQTATDHNADFAIALSHGRRGSVEAARGDFRASADAHAEAASILERIVSAAPSNLHYLHAWMVALYSRGCAERDAGAQADALASLTQAVHEGERLVARDGSREQWRSDLALAQSARRNLEE